jgi:hypothetical protein
LQQHLLSIAAHDLDNICLLLRLNATQAYECLLLQLPKRDACLRRLHPAHLQVDLLLVVAAALHDCFELSGQLQHLLLGPPLQLTHCKTAQHKAHTKCFHIFLCHIFLHTHHCLCVHMQHAHMPAEKPPCCVLPYCHDLSTQRSMPKPFLHT